MTKKNANKLHYETVSPLLRKILNDIMGNSIFEPFYLVGGTSLSLRLGHRKSVDIDLFTNVPYGAWVLLYMKTFFGITINTTIVQIKQTLSGLGVRIILEIWKTIA